jgi:hypothetical protein
MYVEYAYRVNGSKKWEFVEVFILPEIKTEEDVLKILSKIPNEVWVLEIRPI